MARWLLGGASEGAGVFLCVSWDLVFESQRAIFIFFMLAVLIDLFLLIMEHVNILKTVFQEMSEVWREGKVALLMFQNPHQRRYYVPQVIPDAVEIFLS